MQTRSSFYKVAPEAYQAMSALDKYVSQSGLDLGLLHMVKLRVSQINGCAYCIDLHWKDARSLGETEQRLYGLDAWHESPYYNDRERAALQWAEIVTRVGETHVPDAAYVFAREHFDEKELVDLTWAVAGINAWNRMAIAFRSPAGQYQPPKK
ncbi:carboxymuconolactone decarboxylase family protein [soil metagenome]